VCRPRSAELMRSVFPCECQIDGEADVRLMAIKRILGARPIPSDAPSESKPPGSLTEPRVDCFHLSNKLMSITESMMLLLSPEA
jgi:hypothetical protein